MQLLRVIPTKLWIPILVVELDITYYLVRICTILFLEAQMD
jgi:hypothetical protein